MAVGSKGNGGGRLFAVGDVHGCADELRALLQQLPLGHGAVVVFVGDYIDRGPDSRGVVDTILELKDYCEVVCLRGNHEAMLLEFLDGSDPVKVARFIYNGGSATLASYADEEGNVLIPPEHIEFYKELKLFHVLGEYCFVHAGLPVDVPQINLAEHSEEMVWMRRRRGVPAPAMSKVVVHGHTTVREVEISPRHINLDTACVYGGYLSAIELPSGTIHQVPRTSMPKPMYLRDAHSRREAIRFGGRVPVQILHEGQRKLYETVNYSEIGLLLKDVAGDGRQTLGIGDSVQGTIGSGTTVVEFHGQVVRLDKGPRYAIKMEVDAPPSVMP
ncbi:MAG: serine/threonine protein phosphatase [Myxococcales bacterium]|nr:serine/threonine protein phosphatase [Myxococcales bacterium]